MDGKCNPAHSRKMVAQLQHRSAQRNPILLDHTPERGHSPHLPLSVRIAALVKRLSFLCREMDIVLPLEWPK
jgi:prolyl oligopeptidase